jgi:hypothetical protein
MLDTDACMFVCGWVWGFVCVCVRVCVCVCVCARARMRTVLPPLGRRAAQPTPDLMATSAPQLPHV